MIKHRAEEPRTNLLLSVLQGREPITIVQAAVTAFALRSIERNLVPRSTAKPFEPPFKLMTRHSLTFAHMCASLKCHKLLRAGFLFPPDRGALLL